MCSLGAPVAGTAPAPLLQQGEPIAMLGVPVADCKEDSTVCVFFRQLPRQESNHSHALARCMLQMLRDVSFMKALQLADKLVFFVLLDFCKLDSVSATRRHWPH